MLDISTLELHDTRILRVTEDTSADQLIMDVDYPADWFESRYEARRLAFTDAFNYQVHEGPFAGVPTILRVQVVGGEDGWTRLRLETNAGFREVSCKSVELIRA
jgi:hypothetical protein